MQSLRVLCLATVLAAGCASNPPAATSPAASQVAARQSKAVRQLQANLSTIFNGPVMARGVWGVDVRSLDSGEVLFRHNAHRLMMPASNMKILTLAAAAHRLGWDYRFTTTLETTAPIENGVLRGDLIVRGSGDPTIGPRENRATLVFDLWALALRDLGITSIDGRIIGDDQAFDDEGLGPGWSWDYLEAGYAAPVGALQVNDNIAELMIVAGANPGEPAILGLPPRGGLTIVNRTVTVDAGETASVNIRRRLDRPEIDITGIVPVGSRPIRRTFAVLNPTLFFVQSVKHALMSRGIAVTGDAVDGDDVLADLVRVAGVEKRVLVTTESPSLREIATVLMKVSQNQYAETLLKAVGRSHGAAGTTDAGRAAAVETFASWNIPRDSYVMSDGSGLSRYNYIAPTTVTAILQRMYADPAHRAAFVATLPVAGKDGTISTRLRKTRAEGNAVAKTGSIANVRSLSGFVKTQDGEMLVFSIIANDFVIPAATVTWIADVAVETLANFTRR